MSDKYLKGALIHFGHSDTNKPTNYEDLLSELESSFNRAMRNVERGSLSTYICGERIELPILHSHRMQLMSNSAIILNKIIFIKMKMIKDKYCEQ